MARTSTPRRPASTRRSARYTPEQRAERDRELFDRASRVLAGEDPQVIAGFVGSIGGLSARILGYSLNNQVLLFEQAEARGIALSDVDTFQGWKSRGRSVRKGETGLRIIRPIGRSTETDDDQDQPADDRDDAPVRFRAMTVFDISQTDGADTTPDPEAAPAALPGSEAPDMLWNRLVEQITNAGWTVDWPADPAVLAGDRVRIDTDARALRVALEVTAANPDGLVEMTAAVGRILATQRQARREQHANIPTQRAALPSKQYMC